MDLPQVGVRLHGGMAPARCIELARAADAAGFASVWFAENPFHRGVLPAVSACVVSTERVRIGVGVVNPYNRHPTLIAMEFAALDELAAGRALLGIGSGTGAQIERMGFPYRPSNTATFRNPMSSLRLSDCVAERRPLTVNRPEIRE